MRKYGGFKARLLAMLYYINHIEIVLINSPELKEVRTRISFIIAVYATSFVYFQDGRGLLVICCISIYSGVFESVVQGFSETDNSFISMHIPLG